MKEKRHARKEAAQTDQRGPAQGDARGGGGELDVGHPEEGGEGIRGGGQAGETAEAGIVGPPQALGEETNLTAVTRPGLINEANVRSALTEAKGDLYVAACLLEISAWKLDRLIRADAALQAFAGAVETVKANPEYDRMSQAQFASELHRLTAQFAVEGLLVIHEIASSPARTAAEKAVRLEAAIALRNGTPNSQGGSEVDLLLRELNQAYQAHAPRIKEIRTTTVVLEDSRQSESVTLTVAPSPD